MVTGCNIFKKTTKEKETERNKSELSVKSNTNINEIEANKGSVKTDKITTGNVTIYPTKGTISEVDSKGNFKGQADSVKSNLNETDKSLFDFDNHTDRSINILTDSLFKQSSIKKASSSQSVTDWKLYVFMFVIIAFVGLALWLRFRR